MDEDSRFFLVWFLISVAVLSFGYGFASNAWNWFPKSYVERAWRQGRALFSANDGHHFFTSRFYDRTGVQTPRPKEVQPGVTLVTSMWRGPNGWKPEVRIIGVEGDILHRWRIDAGQALPAGEYLQTDFRTARYVHGSHLFPNGDLLVNIQYSGTVRLDACGNVKWRLAEGGHHSVDRSADGTFWIPGNTPSTHAIDDSHSNVFKDINDGVFLDKILHVSEDGTLLKKIDVLNVLFSNGLGAYVTARNAGSNDPTHLNDVEPLDPALADEYSAFEAGDLLVSLRNISLVLVFDPETLDVKWHASGPFFRQHDPDFMGSGRIGIFDNGVRNRRPRGSVPDGSRILAMRPDRDSIEVEVLFPTSRSDPFFSASGGKWQRLKNGNLLLTQLDGGRIVEVGPEGQTVWEYIREPHSAENTIEVSEGTRYSISRKRVASWPCSSISTAGTVSQN